MRKIFSIDLLMLICLIALLAGCSKGTDPAPPRSDGGVPAPPVAPPLLDTATPEQLANSVLTAIEADSFDTFSRLCATWEEMNAYMSTMVAQMEPKVPAEKLVTWREEVRLQRKKLEADWKARPASWKEDFDAIVKEIDWKSITAKGVRVKHKTRKGDDGAGVKQCDIFVELDNGKELYVDDVIETKAGWRIIEAKPLSLRPLTVTAPPARPSPTAP